MGSARAFHLAVGLIAGLLLGTTGGLAGPREDAARLILESGRDLNELPMYGGIEKPEEFRKADEAFISAAIEQLGSHEKASDASVTRGWRYFFKNDPSNAMRRFNQAWLLDPDNGGAYHGFAVVLVSRDEDLDGAEEMFERSIAAPRLTTEVYADYGKFLLGFREDAVRAEPILRTAVEQNPGNPIARTHLAYALFKLGRFDEACPIAGVTAKEIAARPQHRPEQEILAFVLNSGPCHAGN